MELQMKSLMPERDRVVWFAPELRKDRSEPVLDMRTRNQAGDADATGFTRARVFFAVRRFPPQLPILLESSNYLVAAFSRALSEVYVVIEEIPKNINHFNEIDSTSMEVKKSWVQSVDLEMQRRAWLNFETTSSGLKQKLTEQEHGANKDWNLLTSAYFSMNNMDFNISDNAVYKQCTPLGNTVLHLAAAHGNNAIVEKVAQHASELFTATNNNYDTALHVAARAGHCAIIQSLLNSFWHFVRDETNGKKHESILKMILMVALTLFRNNQGNTFLHEAFMSSSNNGAAIFQAFQAHFITHPEFEAYFKTIANHIATFAVNNEGKSLLYVAIEAGCKQVVHQLMDICVRGDLKPQEKSPLLLALNKRSIDILDTILIKKPNWIHLRNEEGRFPLHDAASMGYLEGVSYLINKCASCTMERDGNGFLPIHLACSGGHIKIIQELLKWCPDPTQMLDSEGRNLLHVATKSGKYEVVRYILQHPKLEFMINQKDDDGNTPLHVATIHWHPKIVHALTWDNRVSLALLNRQNETALDIADLRHDQNPSLAQRLTWIALESASTPRSSVKFRSEGMRVGLKKESPQPEQYKDRVDSMIVVSTLIITAAFAAGFTVPGDVDQGVPVMLNHHIFHLFILSLTISLYFSISTTIILMWARLGDLSLALFALKLTSPLLGFSLTSLSIAFLAGIYLLLSKLSWLATIFLVMSVVLILMVVLLYILLWLPSTSKSSFIRYISYYPFHFLAKIAE